MPPALPTYFISHGAPDILLAESAAVTALSALPRQYPKPKAIVVVSAHWTSRPIGITNGEELSAIHDFHGFSESLYDIEYPAYGDKAVSRHIHKTLESHGLESKLVNDRGLDHGAWIPLKFIYPQAEIPVVQVSLPSGSLDQVVALGKALNSLRYEEILIIGSGGSVHNLRALNHESRTDAWAEEFEDWLLDSVEGNHFNRLLNVEDYPESFKVAHPTIEHYSPLVFAWAAGGDKGGGKRLHSSFTYGNLGMSIYRFD